MIKYTIILQGNIFFFHGTQLENNIYKIRMRKCNASLHNLFMDRHTFCIIMHYTFIMNYHFQY